MLAGVLLVVFVYKYYKEKKGTDALNKFDKLDDPDDLSPSAVQQQPNMYSEEYAESYNETL
jgi:hypothetical protein